MFPQMTKRMFDFVFQPEQSLKISIILELTRTGEFTNGSNSAELSELVGTKSTNKSSR